MSDPLASDYYFDFAGFASGSSDDELILDGQLFDTAVTGGTPGGTGTVTASGNASGGSSAVQVRVANSAESSESLPVPAPEGWLELNCSTYTTLSAGPGGGGRSTGSGAPGAALVSVAGCGTASGAQAACGAAAGSGPLLTLPAPEAFERYGWRYLNKVDRMFLVRRLFPGKGGRSDANKDRNALAMRGTGGHVKSLRDLCTHASTYLERFINSLMQEGIITDDDIPDWAKSAEGVRMARDSEYTHRHFESQAQTHAISSGSSVKRPLKRGRPTTKDHDLHDAGPGATDHDCGSLKNVDQVLTRLRSAQAALPVPLHVDALPAVAQLEPEPVPASAALRLQVPVPLLYPMPLAEDTADSEKFYQQFTTKEVPVDSELGESVRTGIVHSGALQQLHVEVDPTAVLVLWKPVDGVNFGPATGLEVVGTDGHSAELERGAPGRSLTATQAAGAVQPELRVAVVVPLPVVRRLSSVRLGAGSESRAAGAGGASKGSLSDGPTLSACHPLLSESSDLCTMISSMLSRQLPEEGTPIPVFTLDFTLTGELLLSLWQFEPFRSPQLEANFEVVGCAALCTADGGIDFGGLGGLGGSGCTLSVDDLHTLFSVICEYHDIDCVVLLCPSSIVLGQALLAHGINRIYAFGDTTLQWTSYFVSELWLLRPASS
jgi:hypothetical protein